VIDELGNWITRDYNDKERRMQWKTTSLEIIWDWKGKKVGVGNLEAKSIKMH
jgi:hypothetical protein